MPRKKKNGTDATNGKAKTTLSENDRLSALVAHERERRCIAEVSAVESRIVALQLTLQQAQKALADANSEHRTVHERLQKVYGTNDATKYNLVTGAITRVEIEVEDATS